jgi:hypothetical protein
LAEADFQPIGAQTQKFRQTDVGTTFNCNKFFYHALIELERKEEGEERERERESERKVRKGKRGKEGERK